MKVLVPMMILMLIVPVSASAVSFTAPNVPETAVQYMPDDTDSFGSGLLEMIETVVSSMYPDLREAAGVSLSVIGAAMISGVLNTFPESVKSTAQMAGTICVAGTLLFNTNAMLRLGADAVVQMCDYGKLLYPVLTAALAAQGGISTSACLYAGTTAFTAILGALISDILLPAVYIYLALAVSNSVLSEAFLKRIKDLVKTAVSWCLKILLTVFTTYLSITGVVSGTTDAASLKAAKVTISSFVPVVGGILSDASESVLVSAGLAKNAAGIYGMLALLALFLGPFIKIGIHYLILKITAAFCELVGTKTMTGLIDDFSAAMGLILAMTGSVCMLLLISTICYMKGAQ